MLAGCGSMLQTTSETQARLNSRLVGTPVEQFFIARGLPQGSFKASDGGVVYQWQTSQRTTSPGTATATTTVVGKTAYTNVTQTPATDVDLVCRLTISTDATGVVKSVQIVADTIGLWSLSMCAEAIR